MLSELDPDLDSPALEPGSTPCSIVSRSGSAGGAVYLLGSPDFDSPETRIVLRNGRTLQSSFRDPGSWCLVDVNLDGMGHLDQSNVPIFDLIDRRILVGFGVPGSTATIEIDGSQLQMKVPDEGADMPEMAEFKNFLVVLCTPEQASTVVDDGKSLYVGASGMDADGVPTGDPSGGGLVRIDGDGSVESIEIPSPRRAAPQSTDLVWSTAPLDDDIDGTSDRFASLKSPSSLHECGVQQGCGWYRIAIDSRQPMKRSLHFPEGSHRLVMFLDGKRKADLDSGNIGSNIVDIKFGSGSSVMTVLAELNGGPERGNLQVGRSGLHHPVEVLERLKDVRSSRKSDVAPIDVFQGRAFIPEAVTGDRSSTLAFIWTFTHRKKSSLRVLPNLDLKGTWILNEEILHRSEPGGPQSFALNSSAIESMKTGRNELVFRPDSDWEVAVDSLRSSLKIHEVVDTLGEAEGTLAFSTCLIPDGLIHEFQPVSGTRRRKATSGPSWSRAQFGRSGGLGAATIDFSNMSRGFAFVDGSEVGSYDSSGVAKIPLPSTISSESVIDIFDEQGVDPRAILLVPGASKG